MLNLADFDITSNDSLVNLARTAEATERYEDMCVILKEFVKRAISSGHALSVEERNLLSVAYKNVIGTRRASWRTLSSDYMDSSGDETKTKLNGVYKEQIENELKETCDEVINIINTLVPSTEECEAKVFYLKMAGDYYRYLAESVGGKETGQKAADFYEQANVLAKDLSETHPIRLGLALNYSVCYFEILSEPKKACELAKSAFDDAISKLDKLEERDYKDSTLIMQLLRDNLTLWTSDQPDVEVQDVPSDEEN